MHHTKILVILTNLTTIPGREGKSEKRTGFDVKSVAYLWNTFTQKKKMTMDICTPRGGEAHMDPDILEMSKNDSVVQEFLKDRKMIDQFKDTCAVRDVKPEEYCLIVLPGGHGSMFDFTKTNELTRFLTKVVTRQQHQHRSPGSGTPAIPAGTPAPVIATIGHGIAGLLYVKTPSGSGGGGRDVLNLDEAELDNILATGEYYLKGKKVTCFTNEEEKKIGYDQILPFFLEDKLRSIGAKVEVASPFEEKVVRESKILVTGQNPNSAKKWAETLCEVMREVTEEKL